jgi:hypothetical protein
MEYLTALILGALGSLLACELYFWAPAIARAIARSAASRLPPPEAERYAEEWLGLLEEVPGHCWRLVHAIGFHWAALRISSDLRAETGQRNRYIAALARFNRFVAFSLFSWMRRRIVTRRALIEVAVMEFRILKLFKPFKDVDIDKVRERFTELMHDDSEFSRLRDRMLSR